MSKIGKEAKRGVVRIITECGLSFEESNKAEGDSSASDR